MLSFDPASAAIRSSTRSYRTSSGELQKIFMIQGLKLLARVDASDTEGGGYATGIRKGAVIDEPYDSLSFMPTILHLLGKDEPGLPGPLIEKLQ